MSNEKVDAAQPKSFFGRMFLTIRLYRDYRLVWLGSLTEHMGEWMENAGIAWLIYQMTGSPVYLALQPAARFIPLVFFSPVGGWVADSVNRRNLVIYTLLWKAAISITLLILVHTGLIIVWHILGAAMLSGFGTVFNHPARHTLIPNLVKKEHLMNAITLDNTSVTASQVVGGPIAGTVLMFWGSGPLFGFGAMGCLLAVVWLLLIRHVPAALKDPRVSTKKSSHWKELVEGFSYLKENRAMLLQVCMYFFSYFATQGYSSSLPVFAKDILDVGPQGYGLLRAAPGVGALIGLFTLASATDFKKRGLYMFFAGGLMTLSIFFFAASPWFLVSLFFLVIVGAMNNTYNAVNNTIIQSSIPDHVRGRVMSLRELISGLGPVSGLFVSSLAKILGVRSAVEVVALGFFGMIVLIFFLFPQQRKT